jgi:hypothetical protein
LGIRRLLPLFSMLVTFEAAWPHEGAQNDACKWLQAQALGRPIRLPGWTSRR